MSLGHGASIVRDGLVLQLDAANIKSYPGNGTVWKDLSGNSNNFDVSQYPFDNENGGSIQFLDGTNRTSIPISFSSTTATISFSAKIETTTGLNYAFDANLDRDAIFKWTDNNTNSIQLRFTTQPAPVFNTLGRPFEWAVYTMTCDSSIEYYYMNGELFGTANVGANNLINFNEIYLGHYSLSNTYSMTGKMGFFQLYDRFLTEQEIKQNFEAIRGRYGL